MIDTSEKRISGHVLIKDKVTNEILVDKFNAINYENFSISLARTLANRTDSWIQEMVFGNGAATVSGTGTITYLPPNVIGVGAQLYNQTYIKVVDDLSPYNSDPSNNYITTAHTNGLTYSDIIVTCNLGVNEPAGQEAFDTATNILGPYVFNELGLKAYDPNGQGLGRLLTHVVFSPVQKSLNRQLEIVYTIRIQTV
jgi:hypothetical protein